MKTFTLQIDDRMDSTINELKFALGKTSRADVIRLAVALLKLAKDHTKNGLKLTLADQDDLVKKEILIDWMTEVPQSEPETAVSLDQSSQDTVAAASV